MRTLFAHEEVTFGVKITNPVEFRVEEDDDNDVIGMSCTVQSEL